MAKKATQLVHVRMPKDLHRKIQRDADRNGQTINAEILRRLHLADQTQADPNEVAATVGARMETVVTRALARVEDLYTRYGKGDPEAIREFNAILGRKMEREEKDKDHD